MDSKTISIELTVNGSPWAGQVICSFVSTTEGMGRGFVTVSGAGGNGAISLMISGRTNSCVRSGSAARAPTYWILPVPLNLPTQTPIAYFALCPTAQASRRPELVPVFHMNQPVSCGSRASSPRGIRWLDESM